MKRKINNCILIVVILFLSSCGSDVKINSVDSTNCKNDKNEILLVNEKFYSTLVNTSGTGKIKIEKAFNSLGIYEPIFFSVFRGGVSRKKVDSHLSGGDFSKIDHGYDYDYYFYYFQNYQGMFEVGLPNIPYLLSAKWHSSDTTFFQTRDYVSNMTINETAYIVQDKDDSSLFLMNGKFKMINISNLLTDSKLPLENRNVDFFREILNTIVLNECSDSLYGLYNPDKWWNHNYVYESIVDKINTKPINYFPNKQQNLSAQVKFQTKEISYIPVKFFPKRIDRDASNITDINNVYGINQFFMDHDLTSGYVHPYTQNFFNRLNDDGFVLCFRRSTNRINEATAFYKRKTDLGLDDVLGENIAFCRQWKLSEIDLKVNRILMKRCKFNSSCTCLQVISTSDNPYNPEIPLWSSNQKEGYIAINELDDFGNFDGGTVTIIWESNNNNEILFKEVHGSIQDIMTSAIEIRDKYNIDPVLGIYDAGSYARKFQSNNGVLDFDIVDRNTGRGQFVGAGYGYLIR
jgi:hypothetical protein